MTRMRAVDAIVQILIKEGATEAFGLPGAAMREQELSSEPPVQAERRHGGEVSFPLKLYDGAWVLSDRRRPTAFSEEALMQVKKGT